jgi:uncharacterized protein YggE
MGKNNAIIVTSIISGVVLLIAILALVVFSPFSSAAKNSVTVEGLSTVKALPDVISIYFTIETTGTTSVEAKDANTLIYDKLVNALVAEGFKESDIKTDSYNVYPNTYWENGKEKTDGFKASHSLKLELSSNESDKLSPAIDAGVKAGAGISYINFELSQTAQNTYKAEALKLASQDAMVKADSVASGFNKKVGKLISVQVTNFGYYPWNVYTARSEGGASSGDVALAKEAAMNINPSEQDITASISATFKLR